MRGEDMDVAISEHSNNVHAVKMSILATLLKPRRTIDRSNFVAWQGTANARGDKYPDRVFGGEQISAFFS